MQGIQESARMNKILKEKSNLTILIKKKRLGYKYIHKIKLICTKVTSLLSHVQYITDIANFG